MAANRDKQHSTRGTKGSPSDAPRVIYTPHPDATPQAETQALAAVYALVLECKEHKHKIADVGDDENGTEGGRGGEPPEEHRGGRGSV